MTTPGLRRGALLGAAATLVAGAAVVWLGVRLPSLAADRAGTAAVVPFVMGMGVLAVVGALVVRERRHAVIGHLLLATGALGIGARLAFGLAVLAHEQDHAVAGLLGWTTNWAWVPALVVALVLVLRFPTGRLPGRRWRWVETTVLVWGAALVLVTALLPGDLGAEQLAPRTNPVGVPVPFLARALEAAFVVQPAVVLAAIAAPVLRWRASPAEERRQLAEVAVALLLVGVTAVLASLSGTGQVLEGVAWLVLPTAIAYAVARHGLWDLEVRRRLDRLHRVREEERSRLQRDLHDSLGPLLGAIAMRAEASRNLLAAGDRTIEVDRLLDSIGSDCSAAVVEVRRLVDELGPLSLADADLLTALRRTVAALPPDGPRVTLDLPGHLPALDPGAEIAAYRVAVEALRNAVRHSGARACRLLVAVVDDDLVVEVADDGNGLRGAPAGVGRRAMADRVAGVGGRFELLEPAEGGVTVRARLEGAVS